VRVVTTLVLLALGATLVFVGAHLGLRAGWMAIAGGLLLQVWAYARRTARPRTRVVLERRTRRHGGYAAVGRGALTYVSR
jgi:hypothetical protein